MTTIRDIILEEATLKEHIDCQNNSYTEYITNLLLIMIKHKVNLSIIKKARILAGALARNDKGLAKFLLDNYNYVMPEILKTCEILDSRRYSTSLKKKLVKIKKDKKRAGKLKSIIANLEKLHEGLQISLTKSKIEFIKVNWIQKLSANDLENCTIQYPTNYWKSLIDLLHAKPSDFQLNWFTSYIFTNECPVESLAYKCSHINKDNIASIVSTYKPSYSYLRTQHKKLLDENVKKLVAEYTEISEILNHWEDFNTSDIYMNVLERLKSVDKLDLPYGELMKKIQFFWGVNDSGSNDKYKELVNYLIELAENKLKQYEFNIEQPVVVLGDASASMNVAIRTSSIIMSILCKICSAKMHLFREKDECIKDPPRTVQDVVVMSKLWQASGCTSPASSLYPYLENKEVVKTFIIVTDEEENTGYDGQWDNNSNYFHTIFKRYREEVYPAKIVFVSFVPDNKDGFMVSKLKQHIPGIENSIIQFRLNNTRPDLRKLDVLLDTLGMQEALFNEEYKRLFNRLQLSEDKLADGKAILMQNESESYCQELCGEELHCDEDKLTVYI